MIKELSCEGNGWIAVNHEGETVGDSHTAWRIVMPDPQHTSAAEITLWLSHIPALFKSRMLRVILEGDKIGEIIFEGFVEVISIEQRLSKGCVSVLHCLSTGKASVVPTVTGVAPEKEGAPPRDDRDD